MSRWIRLLAVSLVLVGACAESQQGQDSRATRNAGAENRQSSSRDGVVVERKPVDVQRRTFDSKNPPSEMPPLSPPEAAVTTSVFSVGARVLVNVLGDRRQNGAVVSEVKIEKVNVELGLGIVIWLPTRATPGLRDHEEGHRRISEHFYEDAEETARVIARPYVGKSYRGEGKDAQGARDAAMKTIITEINQKYMSEVQTPSSKANEEFDRITDHGRNKTPVDRAIERSLAVGRNS